MKTYLVFIPALGKFMFVDADNLPAVKREVIRREPKATVGLQLRIREREFMPSIVQVELPKRLSLAEMKRRNAAKGGHFFDRDTLKFFGESMRNFSARFYGGKNYIYRDSGTKMGHKVFIFDEATADIRPCTGFKKDGTPGRD